MATVAPRADDVTRAAAGRAGLVRDGVQQTRVRVARGRFHPEVWLEWKQGEREARRGGGWVRVRVRVRVRVVVVVVVVVVE